MSVAEQTYMVTSDLKIAGKTLNLIGYGSDRSGEGS
jgi:hypothetical protein